MSAKRTRHAALAAFVALLASSSGCSRSITSFSADQRPVVLLTDAPVRSEGSQSVSYRIRWSGSDADGSVSAYEYAIDPPSASQAAASRDTTWVRTQSREYTFELRESDEAASKKATREFHTFVVRAVSDRGSALARYSEPVSWSFDKTTVAPLVQIVSPQPSPLIQPILIQPIDIRWQGQDPDGQPSGKPAGYKYKLFGPADASQIATWVANPDSLRRFYEPSGYAGWDSVGATHEAAGIDGQEPNSLHLFVVVAFDETGAYSQSFSLSTNMLYFRTAAAGGIVPTLHLGWGFGSQIVAPPAYYPGEFGPPRIKVPAGLPIRFDWYAVPMPGTTIKGYRWVVDADDISDDTRRDNEETDWHRWSVAGINSTTAVVGPFQAGTVHYLYVEVTDNGGRRSGWYQSFAAFDAPLNQDLLVVDDTRLAGDTFVSSSGGPCLRPYLSSSIWPAAAELDTFLYAVGNVPWRGIQPNCPPTSNPPVLTPPGLFAGYRFDTLGTRQGYERPDDAVPLSTLSRYRNIIWMLDGTSAQASDPLNMARPMTALRFMSQSGHASTLRSYIALGGRVWLVGAGGPLASLIDHNRPNNDPGLFGTLFSSALWANELAPGRMIFDQFHWKSELIYSRTTNPIEISQSLASHPPRPGAPDYSGLPPVMRRRTPATDPVPATRPASTTAAFYVTNIDVAYLTQPNFILEDIDPDPNVVNEQSTLDTLYALDGSAGNLYPQGETFQRPIMTYYRGPSNAPTVLSGFAIWDVARPDAQALVDFVLGDLWGLSRQGGAGLSSLRAPARLPVVTPAQTASRSRLPAALGRR